MHSCLLLILWFLIAQPGSSLDGRTVSGSILDEETGNPVAFASIYINNTTIATISDEQGVFTLGNIPVPSQLVISHVSYEPRTIQMAMDDLGKELTVWLKPRLHLMREVSIEDINRRAANLDYFKTEFLGFNPGGRRASILNDSVLFFYRDSDSFIAQASGQLRIDLPETGYTLYVDLLKFEVTQMKDNDWHVSNRTYCYFEEYEVNLLKKRMFSRRRRWQYYGSRMHFLRSFYDNTLLENGFELYEILDYDEVRDRVAGILQTPEENIYLSGNPVIERRLAVTGSDNYLTIGNMLDRVFTVSYYYHPVDFKPADLRYGRDHKDYCVESSYMEFLRDTVIISETGRLPDNSILFKGDMSTARFGSELPEDYFPDKR